MLPSQAIPGVKTTYTVVTEGAGDKVVAKNSKVKVHATGTVVETDKKFWSTKDKGQQPFEYTAGVGGVIKGWDQGCLGMKLGEVRQLTIPADEGYGASGFPAWGIPPNGGLYFGAQAPCRARLEHHSTCSTRQLRPQLSVRDHRSVPRRNRGAADQVSQLCMHGPPQARRSSTGPVRKRFWLVCFQTWTLISRSS